MRAEAGAGQRGPPPACPRSPAQDTPTPGRPKPPEARRRLETHFPTQAPFRPTKRETQSPSPPHSSAPPSGRTGVEGTPGSRTELEKSQDQPRKQGPLPVRGWGAARRPRRLSLRPQLLPGLGRHAGRAGGARGAEVWGPDATPRTRGREKVNQALRVPAARPRDVSRQPRRAGRGRGPPIPRGGGPGAGAARGRGQTNFLHLRPQRSARSTRLDLGVDSGPGPTEPRLSRGQRSPSGGLSALGDAETKRRRRVYTIRSVWCAFV